jgi:hypothetical protein
MATPVPRKLGTVFMVAKIKNNYTWFNGFIFPQTGFYMIGIKETIVCLNYS